MGTMEGSLFRVLNDTEFYKKDDIVWSLDMYDSDVAKEMDAGCDPMIEISGTEWTASGQNRPDETALSNLEIWQPPLMGL